MRWRWPFTIYAGVVLAHLLLLTLSSPAATGTKAALMPALLVAVLLVALWRPAVRGVRAWWIVALLGVGIVASFLGDLLIGDSFVGGLAGFALAHLVYVGAFLGPARTRRPRWWSLLYVPVVATAAAVLWPHLGALAPLVVGYGVVLALTAITATGVNAVVAWGGGLFLASDVLLAFRLFMPGFDAAFPDPWQDLLIMALYCAGEGLIALGLLARIRTRAG